MAKILEYASRMRQAPTDAERIFHERIFGIECFSQVVIGPYIADFLFPNRGIVVELDGGYHEEPEQLLRDTERDLWMQRKGLTIIRIPNAEAATFPLSKIKSAPIASLKIRSWLARAVLFSVGMQTEKVKPKAEKKAAPKQFGAKAAKERQREILAKQQINAPYSLNPHGKKLKAVQPARSPEQIAQERREAKAARKAAKRENRHKHPESHTITWAVVK